VLLDGQSHGRGMLNLIGRSHNGDCVSSGRRARIVYSTTTAAASSNHNGANDRSKQEGKTKPLRFSNRKRSYQNEQQT